MKTKLDVQIAKNDECALDPYSARDFSTGIEVQLDNDGRATGDFYSFETNYQGEYPIGWERAAKNAERAFRLAKKSGTI